MSHQERCNEVSCYTRTNALCDRFPMICPLGRSKAKAVKVPTSEREGKLSNPRARAARARCMEKIYGNLRKPARRRRARAMNFLIYQEDSKSDLAAPRSERFNFSFCAVDLLYYTKTYTTLVLITWYWLEVRIRNSRVPEHSGVYALAARRRGKAPFRKSLTS